MAPRQLPNALTALRLMLVVPVAAAILAGSDALALGLFAVAGVSDALDGYLARRNGWQTPLGRLLDPVADKLLVGVTFIALAVDGRLSAGFVVLVVLRDVLIGLGALVYRGRRGPFRPVPSVLGKLTTLALLSLALVLLLPWDDAATRLAATEGLRVLCVILVLASAVGYAGVWGARGRGGSPP